MSNPKEKGSSSSQQDEGFAGSDDDGEQDQRGDEDLLLSKVLVERSRCLGLRASWHDGQQFRLDEPSQSRTARNQASEPRILNTACLNMKEGVTAKTELGRKSLDYGDEIASKKTPNGDLDDILNAYKEGCICDMNDVDHSRKSASPCCLDKEDNTCRCAYDPSRHIEAVSEPGAYAVAPEPLSSDDDEIFWTDQGGLRQSLSDLSPGNILTPAPGTNFDDMVEGDDAESQSPSEDMALSAVLVLEDSDISEADSPPIPRYLLITIDNVQKAEPQKAASLSGYFSSVELFGVVLCCLFVMVLGLSTDLFEGQGGDPFVEIGAQGAQGQVQDDYEAPDSLTLSKIRAAGFFRCVKHETQNLSFMGLETALCRAVAAAILGPSPSIEYIDTSQTTKFRDLAEGRLDLLAAVVTHTMEYQVYESTQTMQGFSFSIPYLYGDQVFAGDPFFIDCLQNNFYHINECSELKVCVGRGSPDEDFVRSVLPERRIELVDDIYESMQIGMAGSLCNVVAFGSFYLELTKFEESGWMPNIVYERNLGGKHPVALVTRADDPIFSDLVNCVLQALFAAEFHNVMQASATKFPETSLFGWSYANLFQNAIEEVGTFGEILNRTMGSNYSSSLQGIKDRNKVGSTGLLYSQALGKVEARRDEAEVPLGPILRDVLSHGRLRCGVETGRPGFAAPTKGSASLGGMDIDYCRAVAASLFGGDGSLVDFIELSDNSEGYMRLASREIDLLAGVTWNWQSDIREEVTKLGFAFSQPYFYGYSEAEDNFCVATRQDDHDWSSFVYWIVAATVLAEEKGITQATSFKMPQVFLYGEDHSRMFRDVILMVGNYQEIYERNVEAIIPRSGRNTLSSGEPRHYVLPGIFP